MRHQERVAYNVYSMLLTFNLSSVAMVPVVAINCCAI